MKPRPGYSLIEMLMVVAIGTGVIMIGVEMLPGLQKYFLYNRMRQQAANEARATLDVLRSTLSHGQLASYVISSTDNLHPNSDIKFSNATGTQYEIGWSPGPGPIPPVNSVFLRVTSSNPAQPSYTTVLAQNVSVFNFNPDPNDPAGIIVTFESETAMDSSQSTASMYRITLPPQSIRMAGS